MPLRLATSGSGVHWAIDFGAGDYGLPSYFDKGTKPNQRYSWYRKSTRAHNTWTFNGTDDDVSASDQDMNALSYIAAHSDREATIDLMAAYAQYGATKLQRTLVLSGAEPTSSVVGRLPAC
eukprot:m.297393 g.297393  ORF g.297393 m.297393 type:complete len:121 (+) comp81002_c0_seq1:391-753(+)